MNRPASDTYAAVLDTLASVAASTYAIAWSLGLGTEQAAPAPDGATDRDRAELAALSLYHLWGRINTACHRKASDTGATSPAPGTTAGIRSRLNVAYMAIMDGELQRATRTLRHLALDAADMREDHDAATSDDGDPRRMIGECAPTPTTTR